jgi:hypothetical protein
MCHAPQELKQLQLAFVDAAVSVEHAAAEVPVKQQNQAGRSARPQPLARPFHWALISLMCGGDVMEEPLAS